MKSIGPFHGERQTLSLFLVALILTGLLGCLLHHHDDSSELNQCVACHFVKTIVSFSLLTSLLLILHSLKGFLSLTPQKAFSSAHPHPRRERAPPLSF